MIRIEITPADLERATEIGRAIRDSAIQLGRQREPGRVDDGYARHIEGAIGELAAARALGLEWNPTLGKLDTETGDLPDGWQVKTTRLSHGSLIIRPHDPARFRYCLITLEHLPAAARWRGWISGKAGKSDRFWRDRDPARGIHRAAFFVPQWALVRSPP